MSRKAACKKVGSDEGCGFRRRALGSVSVLGVKVLLSSEGEDFLPL